MKQGQIIKHVNAMDVCLLIDEIRPDGKILGSWINLGFIESFWIGEKSEFYMKDPSQWQVCQDPIETCLRYAEWI